MKDYPALIEAGKAALCSIYIPPRFLDPAKSSEYEKICKKEKSSTKKRSRKQAA